MAMYDQYIYSLVLYIINNKHIFNLNKEIHKYKTRALKNLHLSAINVPNIVKVHTLQVLKFLIIFHYQWKCYLLIQQVLKLH
jgi:hypothetical protein